MLSALLLLSVLAIGSEGAVPAVTARLRRAKRAEAPAAAESTVRAPASLAARGLEKRFGGLVAVRDLDVELKSERALALIGPNGSGKTTALRLLAGALDADGGAVLLDGRELGDAPASQRVRLGVVRTLQANAVFPGLTALENALVGASLRRRFGGPLRSLFATPKARAEARETRARALAALRVVGLEGHAQALAETMTGPEQRLLMLASALATEPRVLLLDEPSAGSSSADLERLARILVQLRADGFAVLAVEHDLRLVRRVADEVVVLHAGAPLASGTAEEIARDPAVRAAYLGRHQL
jgi:ABC-type branched-subunit amino acid transport system ATPase component